MKYDIRKAPAKAGAFFVVVHEKKHIVCSRFLNVLKGFPARHNPVQDTHRLDIEVSNQLNDSWYEIKMTIDMFYYTCDRLSLEVGIWKIKKQPGGRMSLCP